MPDEMPVLFLFSFPVLAGISQSVPDSTVFLDELVISANKIPELRSKVAQ
jgi:hypothetical protein